MMPAESRPGSLSGLTDDALGAISSALFVSEVEWTPDVTPAVMDRISRDAVAYPEQFDRRSLPPPARRRSAPTERSTSRTAGRLAVFGVIVVVVVGLVGAVATASASAAELDDLEIDLVEVASGYDQPVLVVAPDDGSGVTYVVEQTGRIRTLAPDGADASPFLDLSDAVSSGGERGLLGLAFHPEYAANGRFFVNYTRSQDGATVVSEMTSADGAADRDSERELLVIEQPFGNHNGGMLAFDAAGMLLVGTGDGGSGGDPLGAGQNPDSLLGKLLRLDVDSVEPYAIPEDNGFAATDAHRPEIHAKGLRNPWRFSVDPDGGHIYVGDVGQNRWEEISVLAAGAGGQSFGWNPVEGPECYVAGCDMAAHVAPSVAYTHDEGCSVAGGYVYRGERQPGLAGVYLYGDYCSGTIWGASAAALVSGAAESVRVGEMDGSLSSFGIDAQGEIYAVDLGGRIFHVVTEAS